MTDDIFDAAEAWEAAGKLDLAIAAYEQLAADTADATPKVRRASLLRELGEVREAEEDLIEAARKAPEDPWPLMRLGQLYNAVGRNVTEAAAKQKALDRAPESFEMRVNAIAAYSHVNWLDRAWAIAKTLPPELPDWWASARQTAIQRYRTQHAETRALLRTRRTAPDRILFIWELCQRLFELGRLSMARALCEILMREIPSSFPAFFFYSRILSREHGPAAAAAFLHHLAWLHRTQAEYPYALARQLHELGDYAGVLDLTRHGSAQDDPEELRYIRSVCMLMLNRQQELRSYCHDWIQASPGSVPPAGFITAAHLRVVGAPGSHGARVYPTPAPVLLAQFWHSREVPDDVLEVMDSWSRRNSGIHQQRFDDTTARSYLSAHFGGDVVEAYGLCHHPAMKADVFRIAFLLQTGGIWADADERCMREMGHVLRPAATSALTAALSGDTPGYLHNFFLGARAGSEVMRLALEDAVAGVRLAETEARRPDIWQVTGPGVVTRAAATFIIDVGERADVLPMPLAQYRALVRTDTDLAYKRKTSGNWQLA